MTRLHQFIGIMMLNTALVCFAGNTQPVQQRNARSLQLQAELNTLLDRNRTRLSTRPETQAGGCSICWYIRPGSELNTCICSNRTCNDCILGSCQANIHFPSRIRCLCGEPLPIERGANADLLHTLIENFRKEITEASLDGKFCPTHDCQYHYIDQVPKSEYQLIQCPECNKQYCTHCLINHEQSISCENTIDAQKKNENKESPEWIQNNTQPCPNCNKPIQKDGGCDHMICWSCHHGWQWQPTDAERRQWEEAHRPMDDDFDDLLQERRNNPAMVPWEDQWEWEQEREHFFQNIAREGQAEADRWRQAELDRLRRERQAQQKVHAPRKRRKHITRKSKPVQRKPVVSRKKTAAKTHVRPKGTHTIKRTSRGARKNVRAFAAVFARRAQAQRKKLARAARIRKTFKKIRRRPARVAKRAHAKKHTKRYRTKRSHSTR